MKKVIFGLLLIVGIRTSAYSIEESWFSFGTGFGNYFDSGSDLNNNYFGSPGINFSGYLFSDQKNTGAFFNYGFLFPVIDNIENNYQPYFMQLDFIMGQGFRFNLNERLYMHFGAGLAFNIYGFMDEKDINEKITDSRFSIGIGGDVGVKYDITDIVYVNFGTALTYNFAGYSVVESTLDNWTNTRLESSDWINGYSMFGIRPYIAIGFNYYQTKGKWGKPNN